MESSCFYIQSGQLGLRESVLVMAVHSEPVTFELEVQPCVFTLEWLLLYGNLLYV